MTDARIVATNPADSSVVPVACNENGELLLADGTTDQFVEKAGDTMTGNLHLGDKIILNPDGSAQFAGGVVDIYSTGKVIGRDFQLDNGEIHIKYNGADRVRVWTNGATFFKNTAYDTESITIGNQQGADNIVLNCGGSAKFRLDVIIGSRGKQWMIVESNGLAHLVDQAAFLDVPADESANEPVQYPALRNIPQELDLIERALGEVMEKLRMSPPAGWEVWDGSDEN